jgi:hypothetical protein
LVIRDQEILYTCQQSLGQDDPLFRLNAFQDLSKYFNLERLVKLAVQGVFLRGF